MIFGPLLLRHTYWWLLRFANPVQYCILTLSQYLFYSNLLKITRQSLLYSIFPTNHHQTISPKKWNRNKQLVREVKSKQKGVKWLEPFQPDSFLRIHDNSARNSPFSRKRFRAETNPPKPLRPIWKGSLWNYLILKGTTPLTLIGMILQAHTKIRVLLSPFARYRTPLG